ncbi:sugar kinase [Pseudovibrio sp. SPO723]|uniref:sugar kinase n=1 Tax=Nesiotobacter zosterae TaxID=392721 RepID=UPI0029C487EB|nr:sugar kinase [Pseudovibrio sp. SPO723]MDX5594415.1 sugar kinase [Pseudovibrio sp. SPO723]
MTIACVGITVLDRVFRVSQLPTTGGKFVAKDYFEVGGGPAATAAVAISKLGTPVEFIGRVGSDDVAQTMLREFASYGVGHSHVKQFENAASSFSAILVDDAGERMIINYQSAQLSRDPEWLKKISFEQFQSVLCDVRWIPGAKYALEQAKCLGIPSVLDADITPEDITELVELADHVAFSEPGLAKFSQVDDPLEGLRIAQTKTNGKVYVTVGSKGCYWLENGELCHQPGFKVDVVDTTGAGDVFHGAFALAVADKMDARAAVTFSSAVAALKCTKLGGREGVPDRSTAEAFIKANT